MDIKETALGSLRGVFRIFLQDLQALPEEAYDKLLGGKARTVADLVHEVNLVNDHIGLNMRGEPLFDWPEGWITAPEGVRTKDAAIEAFGFLGADPCHSRTYVCRRFRRNSPNGTWRNHAVRALSLYDTACVLS